MLLAQVSNVTAVVVDFLIEKGASIVGVLALLVAVWLFSGWLGKLVATGMRRAKIDETLTRFVARLVQWSLITIAIICCLGVFGVETTSFAAVIGAAGLAIGLAFQGTLSNFAAGVMLLVFRPFEVNDVIKVADVVGKVYAIDLFTIAIDTFDNRRFVIPNSQVFGGVIENITFHPVRRADVAVGVSYSADIDKTREVLEGCVANVEGALTDPTPLILLDNLGASSVDWKVMVWANSEDWLKVKQGTIRAVKMSLDEAGIEIPFPQMQVHMEK